MSLDDNKRDKKLATCNETQAMAQIYKQQQEKYNEFKKRIEAFNTIETIEEAKELSEKILPVSNEKTTFRVGNGKCTIINRDTLFRISLNSQDEFISYDFI